MKAKRSKFNAVRTTLDGVVFASKAEARRYLELKMLQKAKRIDRLMLQPAYPLTVNGTVVGKYIADFGYLEKTSEDANQTTWQHIVEDVKGVRTPIFALKCKLMRAIYGVTIRETGRTR